MNTMSKRLRLCPVTISLLAALLCATGCASKQKGKQQQAAFWPQYPDEPRVQFLVSFDQSSDIEPPKSSLDQLVMGKEDEQVLNINKPYGVDMWNGRIYVCDLRNQAVNILDLRKRQVLVMGKSTADALQKPTDIAIAPDGMKYVSDNGKGRIVVFDAQDRQIGSFMPSATYKPVSVAVFGNELFVCDFASQTIGVLDRFRGTYLRTIGKPGPGDGEFIRPLSVETDAEGNVYVMDVLKCQLQKFDRNGKLLGKFGTTSNNAGGLVRPKQMAVDKEGQIYVVDAAFQNVQVFNQNGQPLTFFGTPGAHPGAMYLPVGIAIHEGDLDLFKAYYHPAFEPTRLIVVTNQFGNNKVSVYALGRLAEGKTIADVAESQGIVPSGVGDIRNSPAPLDAATTQPDFVIPATQPVAGVPAQPAAQPKAPAQPQPTQSPQQQVWQPRK